ncbi:hypothetical protein NP233_g9903 [Leucocoprinus birnbaumii]|uniref:RNA helicase n=1 Tax=Leucocoprinus birnbaumii TaxID=56174 RepID=A0AAD5VN44_9AGAR|nr:hypothetical protein NP233_g9903 [Leucocoprinus birnbaumii]
MDNCPNLLASGSCNDPSCSLNHNILTCDVCSIIFCGINDYRIHLTQPKHLTRAAGRASHGMVHCPICKIFMGSNAWSDHQRGQKHARTAKSLGVSIEVEPEMDLPVDIKESHQFCSTCQVFVGSIGWTLHIRGRRHKRSQEYMAFVMAQGEAEKDKNNVGIQGDLDFRIVEPAAASRGLTKAVIIRSTSPSAKINLKAVRMSAEIGSSQTKITSPFSVKIEGGRRQVSMAHPINVVITFKQEFIGHYQDRVEIRFEDVTSKKQFIISRTVKAAVGDPSMYNELKPREPYVPRVPVTREPELKVVEGVKPPSQTAIPYVSRLPEAPMPKRLVSALTTSSAASRENVQAIQSAFLPSSFDAESHGRHFKTMLWIEEFRMEQDLECYDMPSSTLKRSAPFYRLRVPGLAEKRPSVLTGDRILVRKANGQQGHWYEGHVHFVEQNEVGLRFHHSFGGWSPTQQYYVRFKLNRIPIRRQHQALDTIFTQSRILFPNSSHLPKIPVPSQLTAFFNLDIKNNPFQRTAIAAIVNAPPGTLPFIVFGPPGTGKTVTIVEAIKQILRKDQNAKILACAPSNSAADVITLKLADSFPKEEMFRMNAPSRPKGQVRKELESYTYYRNDLGPNQSSFSVPALGAMKKYRVIVTTCISAAILRGIGMTRGHFSHIFIDEAGQATEPEILTSVKTFADTKTNLVLSGDHKQLGPIIRSQIASALGLEVSYLERLILRQPYSLKGGSGKRYRPGVPFLNVDANIQSISVVKLIHNFRSHQNILKFPNERFYEDELVPRGPAREINSYLGWPHLPNKKFPIIFHATYGKDEREASSPSFFNIDEIMQVKLYVDKLKEDRKFRASDDDIGVIAPYHSQCQKIRASLRKAGCAGVRVGSVEEFQGEEKKVIIMSTVRSSKEFVFYDVRHTLGFVASPRRFNVSVTRAKALLIIIGDPNVLGLDPLWRSFLNYIYGNKGWKGPDIPWDPSQPVDEAGGYDVAARNAAALDMNDFTRRMENLAMEGAQEEDPDALFLSQHSCIMKNCANLLNNGACDDPNCKRNHNILTCDVCNIVFRDGVKSYNQHLVSRRHISRASGAASKSGLVYCAVCDVLFPPKTWDHHKAAKKHLRKVRARGLSVEDVEPEIDLPARTHQFCATCQVYIQHSAWTVHINGRRHRRCQDYTSFKLAQSEAEKDKNDVGIQGDLIFNIVEPSVAGQGITKTIEVRSTAPLAKIKLVAVKLSAEMGAVRYWTSSPFIAAIEGDNRQLSTLRAIKVAVTFRQEFLGRYQDWLEVQFEDLALKKQFSIARMIEAIVGDPFTHQQLQPQVPYIPRARKPREPELNVVEGVKPPSQNAIPYVSRLPKAEIPKSLLSSLTVSSAPSVENIRTIQRAFLPKVLDDESHGRHLKVLLWIEEFKMEQDLERYDILDSTLQRNGLFYHLQVPGLAEKRPSVLTGDRILVRKQDGQQGHWYEGHVHFVHQHEVGLRFHQSFGGWSPSQKYHVRFKLNRIPVRRQHQALDTAFTQSRVLFPNSSHLPMIPLPQPPATFFNPLIQNNPPQMSAIAGILESPPGSLPFVVFGPPGTGKTITVVEAIKQLLRRDQKTKILACAPSNSAADLIALRLCDTVSKDDMFRMYAPSRYKNQVPDELEPYTYYRDDFENRPSFGVPPFAKMKKYRVIVSTCISAAILTGIGMTRGHFSHIFIDEAGQATEPEVFVSVKTLVDTTTNVILSGDPKQLGPIIRSEIACRLGLEVSYLERLMERPPYELQSGSGKSIVKLIQNFRSHESILRFPNERFYASDLVPRGPSQEINAYLGSPYLPNGKFPIVFHAIFGKDDREASSPSFFNIDEATQVKLYIDQLKEDRTFRTREQDIGVIAPYHAQCQKIRRLLDAGSGEVKVGSVEEFQGQERKVIIISTVRSSKEFVSYDIRHTLGFVASPRRFNVSVTRAKALLIIIGDPNVLGLDPLWRLFLNYIHNNNGWKGPDIPWDPSEPVDEAGGYDIAVRDSAALDMNAFTRRMENLTMEGVQEEDPDAGVDKPWRELE